MIRPLRDIFNERYSGVYQFDDFIHGEISSDVVKKFKRSTVVYVASDRLRAFQSFLNETVLETLSQNSNIVFSYRKGFGIGDAVAKHAKSKHFYQTDIKGFFSSINSILVRKLFFGCIPQFNFENPEQYIDRFVELTTADGHLPMGFSTSPRISNSSLYEFDEKFSSCCASFGLIYTRYSDDLIISGNDMEKLNECVMTIPGLLREIYGNAFTLNFSKSKFTHVGRKIKLLGLVLLPNGKVTIERKMKDRLESLIYFYFNKPLDFIEMVSGDVEKGKRHIAGTLSYIYSIDKNYIEKLRRKYGVTSLEVFLQLP